MAGTAAGHQPQRNPDLCFQTGANCLRCSNLDAMVQPVTFTARYETVEDGWVQATIDELPGVITAASSYGEAKELLADALRTYLLALGDLEEEPETPHRGDAEPLQLTVSA